MSPSFARMGTNDNMRIASPHASVAIAEAAYCLLWAIPFADMALANDTDRNTTNLL